MRFLTPILFFAAAAYVSWYNQNHVDRLILAYVFDILVPSSKGDPFTQGRLTVYALGGAGLVFLIRDIVWTLRIKRGVQKDDQ